MSAMAQLSELYEESNDLQMDVMAVEGDLPQMEVGPAEAEAPPPGPAEPGDDDAEDWEDWEDDYGCPEEAPLRAGAGAGSRAAALDEADKVLLRTARARDKTPFDQLAFIEELFSLMVVNRLTEELGCDEIVDRE